MSTASPAGDLHEHQEELKKLRTEYTRLFSLFIHETTHEPVDVGGDLLIDLAVPRRSQNSLDESAAREALMGSRASPSSLRKNNKTVRFRDALVDTDELDNQQVLQLQQRVVDEQDESLDRLSASIRNQRELSIQIGEELDSHVRLLDDVEALVDRHQSRMDLAKKKLTHVARAAKDHGEFWRSLPLPGTELTASGSLMVIIILIIILVLLIAILK
jgi:syntaxin 8